MEQKRGVPIVLRFGLGRVLESGRDGIQLWECLVYGCIWEQKLGL